MGFFAPSRGNSRRWHGLGNGVRTDTPFLCNVVENLAACEVHSLGGQRVEIRDRKE